MWISKATVGGLAAAAGFSALALAPAQASDLYYGNGPAPVYAEPAPVYEAYPQDNYVVAPAPRVVVRPAPQRVIVREAVPETYRREVYVRDVPVPPAPVGGYYEGGYDDAAYGDDCQPVTRETPSGRVIAVGNTCD
jgi:hypothetical protein